MTNQISESIKEIIKNLRSQDNLSTFCPIFVVQRKEKHYHCTDTGEYIWLNNDFEEADQEKAEELENQWDWQLSEENYKEGWSKVGYKETWESVQPFFTKVAAQRYINCNGHNLGGSENCRIYVESGYRNVEWQTVRDFLLTLDARETD